MKRFTALFLCGVLTGSGAFAADVTVYNENLGLVRETRRLDIKAGESSLRVVDVPARIDPTSVHIESLSKPGGLSVLEQNYEYDLISREKLLQKYIGKEIELERFTGPGKDKRETIKGTLLSAEGGRVLRSNGKILVDPPGEPVLPDLPDGLVTRPTLEWRLNAKSGGEQDVQLTYLTEGLSWNADYVLELSPSDDKIDLVSWVTIDNRSGATFKDARLKLVAGDVNRAPKHRKEVEAVMFRSAAADQAQFQQEAFFEYHLYSLGRPTTLRDNQTKQIELTRAAGVGAKKQFVFDASRGFALAEPNEYTRSDPNFGMGGDTKVWTFLEFVNGAGSGLGNPLPRGRVRVYKKDQGGALQFVGEDAIDHTPKNETVRIRLGRAFDIVGERARLNFTAEKRFSEETFEIKLRNRKDQAATVAVVERLSRWSSWKITQSSLPHKKKDAQTVEFQVPVPKNGEAVLTYTVRYAW